MSLFEFLFIGHTVGRGLRLPLLLGRLHLGLIFSGPSSSSSARKSSSEKCSLRSFLFIATVLIAKCGSSAFPNRNNSKTGVDGSISSLSPMSSSPSTSTSQEDMIPFSLSKYYRNTPPAHHLDADHQDYPLQHLLSMHAKGNGHLQPNGQYIGTYDGQTENVKTLGYVLKGMILPMLISLTLSFGFIIYKNRLKRARLQAIQNALEAARLNPNQLIHPQHTNGLVSNALLSVLDARGEWSLISGGDRGELTLEHDDYIGEGGETARHKPYMHDRPPDYASVFDPPTYEQATAATATASSSASLDTSILKKKESMTSISVVDSGAVAVVCENEQLLPPIFSSSFGLGEDSAVEDEPGDESEDEEMNLISSTTGAVFRSLFD